MSRQQRWSRQRDGSLFAVWRLVSSASALLAGIAPGTARAEAIERPLTTAAEVRALAVPGMFRELPVRLKGVVTHVEPASGLVFLQDGTGAAVLEVGAGAPALAAGRLVNVDGATRWSVPLPHVGATHLEALGEAPLPSPRRVPAEEVVAGRREGERVELEGIVRSGGAREDRTWIKLATAAASIELVVDGMSPAEAERLADARVSVVGVAGSSYSRLRQWIGSRLFVGRPADLRVLDPSPGSPFDLPLVAASQVFGRGAFVRRVRVQGVVTRHRLGFGLYIRDGDANLYLESSQGPALRPGDLVEAAGFPSSDRYAPTLEDAVFRKTTAGPPPVPVPRTARQIVREAREAELVRVEGLLLGSLPGPEEHRLLMTADGLMFAGRLARADVKPPIPGSELAVTGVVYLREAGSSFELLLRSADDIVVLRAPSWWTRGRLLTLLAAAAVTGTAWVATLRKRVRRQARIIETQIEREAALAEQARLQAAIQNAATEWQRTFDSMEDAVLILDLDGRILRLNRAARDAIGGSYASALGQRLTELGPGQPWARAAALVAEVAERGEVAPCQVWNGTQGQWWDLTVAGMPAAAGGRVILVAREVTHTMELQESVRRSETMAAMGTLVAGVAHEVRNPLFAISVGVDALQAELEDSQGLADVLGVLHREVDRLRVLMEDLLEYGKPVTVTLFEGPLEAVIDGAIQSCATLASAAGVRIHNSIARGSWVLRLNRKRLAEVFENLLRNAIQHSPRGSAVAVEAEGFRRHGGAWVRCRVADQGPGFRPEDLPRVFEPFFSRRRGGTGLGLAIVRRIVEEHDGKTYALNRDEGGAVMVVELPCVDH